MRDKKENLAVVKINTIDYDDQNIGDGIALIKTGDIILLDGRLYLSPKVIDSKQSIIRIFNYLNPYQPSYEFKSVKLIDGGKYWRFEGDPRFAEDVIEMFQERYRRSLQRKETGKGIDKE